MRCVVYACVHVTHTNTPTMYVRLEKRRRSTETEREKIVRKIVFVYSPVLRQFGANVMPFHLCIVRFYVLCFAHLNQKEYKN